MSDKGISKFLNYPKRKKLKPNTRCPTCLGWGFLVPNPDFKEPYGYPYRAYKVDCDECKGAGWIYKKK